MKKEDLVRRRLIRTALVAALWPSCALASPIYGRDVTHQDIGGVLGLKDHDDRERHLLDFRGKVLLIFFGYTHCPEFCPTILSALSQAMKLLGRDAKKVQVLWVTLDPEHDTPTLLRNYLTQFDPRFIALRGNPTETKKVADAFRVSYRLQKIGDETFVDHSTSGYLVDSQGRTRVQLFGDLTPEQIAADARRFL